MVSQRDQPVTVPDAPPSLHPVAVAPPPGGGAWPVLGATSVALMLAGLVLGGAVSVAGLVLALATGVGWLARVSSEHTGRSVTLLPLALPVMGLFSIASLIFFMSRILLAVPEQASTAIALVVAISILGGASLVATRPSISGRALAVVLGAAGAVLVAAGLVAAAAGERREERGGRVAQEKESKTGSPTRAGAAATGGAGSSGVVTVKAQGLAFAQPEIDLKAQSPVDIRFDNADEGTPHNIDIAATPDFANPVFRGELVTGKATADYRFTAPAPGTYLFRCDVHPNMQGKVNVA
jgi:plastocyanin